MTFIHDPQAVLDYSIDWSQWLGDDTIISSSWSVPDGLTVVGQGYNQSSAVVWLSGGVAGRQYVVTNRIETAGGRRDERSITLRVLER